MSRQSRETLKGYFQSGSRPTEDDFVDLIDSALNINDEGFRKTPPDGLRVKSLGDNHALMSFYTAKSQDDAAAEWRIAFGEDFKKLAIQKPESAAPLLTLDPDGRVGVNTTEPQDELDVAGTVRAQGRRGQEVPGLVADGKYHPLTGDLRGLQALEVVAGVGLPDTGRFALVHAIALNTFNPIWWDDLLGLKKRIRAQHAYYSRGSDRLQLRWAPTTEKVTSGHGEKATYRLEIRTRRDYLAGRRSRGELAPGEEVYVRAFVTRLWFDDMYAAAAAAGEAKRP
jgi:hypothetical protein